MNLLLKILKSLYQRIVMTYKWSLFKIAKNWIILNRIHVSIRPAIWRLTGCKIGKNVSIGYDVYYDVGYASYIHIDDNVWVSSRALLLCHKRDMSKYFIGDDYKQRHYIKRKIILKKGCAIGMGTIILPGVTIGEGAIIGAGSVVVKDIPEWTIAVGNPCKVIRKVPTKIERK